MASNNNKQYIHPAEERQDRHEKNKQKKKKKNGIVFVLLLVIIIAALLLLMKYLGIGFGGGKGDGGSAKSGDTSTAQVISAADESSEAEKTVVTVKISGSTYIYGDSVYTLDKFESDILSVVDKTAVVFELLDDNATANAVEDMHDLLDENEIDYIDKTYEADSETEDSVDLSEEAVG